MTENNPTKDEELFTISEASVYTKLAIPTLKHHIYYVKDLKASKFGHLLAFHKRDLDAFLARKRPAHRPKNTKPRTAKARKS